MEVEFPLTVFPKIITMDYSPLFEEVLNEWLMVKNDFELMPNFLEYDDLNNLPLSSIKFSYQAIQMDSKDDDKHTPLQY